MNIQENILLKNYSNYRIGGPAKYFCEVTSVDELCQAIDFAKEKNIPVFILGGGTNILFKDNGFDGLILKISLTSLREEAGIIFVEAGVMVKTVLEFVVEKNLSGLEWAGGLPGTFGGAIRGNAGCFGGETKDSVYEVKSLNIRTKELIKRNKEECEFKYRSSIFKTRAIDEVIIEVGISLHPGEHDKIKKSIEEKIEYRATRHPMEYPNIGSIFKNVPIQNIPNQLLAEFSAVIKQDPFPVVPAAYLISETGLKGAVSGGAMISTKHPNFIVNTNNASAKDVLSLIKLIKESVYKKFSISLEEEVILIL